MPYGMSSGIYFGTFSLGGSWLSGGSSGCSFGFGTGPFVWKFRADGSIYYGGFFVGSISSTWYLGVFGLFAMVSSSLLGVFSAL